MPEAREALLVSDEYTTGEIVRTLKRLEQGQVSMETKLDNLATGFVPLGVYEAWRTSIDREIKDLKDNANASRAPWWSVLGAIVSTLAFIVTLIVVITAKS